MLDAGTDTTLAAGATATKPPAPDYGPPVWDVR